MSGIRNALALVAVLALAGCGGGGGGGDSGTGGGSALAPTISAQPAAVTVADGGTAGFSTVAAGNAPLTYQWRRNGVDLVDGAGVAGASSAALNLSAPFAFNASQISVRVSNSSGSVTSNSALLTVTPTAPSISTQPANAAVPVGAAATFSAVVGGGTAPVTYQWKRNGTAIAGATGASYTIAKTAMSDDGATLVLAITNPAGTLSSAAATLQVLVPPSITKQPADLSVTVGAPASFSVELSGGTPPVLVQWKRNGTLIVGAVERTYTIPATELGDDGATFAAQIFSAAGPLSSADAKLTVTPAGPGFNLNVNTTDDRLDDDTSDGVCHTSVNTCSLRAAIMQANRLTVPLVRINVPAGIYMLTRPVAGSDDETSGNLNFNTGLAAAIVIAGAGASSTVIDANRLDNALSISINRVITVSGLTIRNGVTQPFKEGGAIFNKGSLTVTDCVIEGNRTDGGGGGIYSGGTLQVIRSIIRSNRGHFGGGLYLFGPSTVRDSVIHGNHAGSGGGIYNDLSVSVVNSTVSQNTADDDGGGINNDGAIAGNPSSTAVAALYNTTVTDNDADHDHDEGGGIGGGVVNKVGSRFIMVNSLIARNTLVDSPIYNECKGNLEIQGVDLLGPQAFEGASGCTFNGGSGTAGVIQLGDLDTDLRDNGGPTLTLALRPGSAAIDVISVNLACVDEKGMRLTADQRGAPRQQGELCDVGAYEFGAVVP